MWGYRPPIPLGARRGASLGPLIREWRLGRGWSQRDLERISGVNQSIISRLENGRVVGMQLSTLGRLAWALKAEEAALLALAPDGGEAIQEIAASGDGPTRHELAQILRKRPLLHDVRPRGRRAGAADPPPTGRRPSPTD
ncbi:MAG TPA: helix-turn-helix transcriptional regulator [Candidatus Sulfotelmatobacter sp.]|nr:helix-turn-helix transcriptional regulator [Candidatus Sulfotelmatobacter sp.]